MKYYSLIILVLAVLNTQGQDTAKHLSRSSVSFMGGLNVIYANSEPLISNTAQFPNAVWDLPYWDLKITPLTSVNPSVSLSYNYTFYKNTHFYYDLHAGFTFLQYSYKMTANGYYYTGSYDSGTFKAQADIDAFEFNIGISVGYKISNKWAWHNEIDILEGLYNTSFPSFSTNAPSPAPFYEIVNPDGLYYDNGHYTYLFFQTGFDYKLSERISIMPEFSIPLINVAFITTLGQDSPFPVALPSFPWQAPIYRSFRTGIMLTYNFNKK